METHYDNQALIRFDLHNVIYAICASSGAKIKPPKFDDISVLRMPND